jgi:hypothetical protein
MKSRPASKAYDEIRRFISFNSFRSEETRRQLIDYLQHYGTKADEIFFILWRFKKIQLSRAEVSQLLQCHDLWIRVQTYSLWPDKCEPNTRQSLLSELKALQEQLESALDSSGEKR